MYLDLRAPVAAAPVAPPAPFCARCEDVTEPYTILDPFETIYGDPVGYITDACTGITVAHYQRGAKVAIGVPLCGGCDEPLA